MSNKNRPKSASKQSTSTFRNRFHSFFHRGEGSFESSPPEVSRRPKSSSKHRQDTQNTSQASGQSSEYRYYNGDQATTHNLTANSEESAHMAPRVPLPKTDEKNKSEKLKSLQQKSQDLSDRHPSCQFYSEKKWLELQYNKTNGRIMKPDELEYEMESPPVSIEKDLLDRIQGSMIGMALGDALGAHVEFRPRQYLLANQVTDLVGGGTWGLQKGQFTDDTSMALCLANSLLARKGFCPYDQLVRYKWWYQLGYMSSTGQCFDIGNATRQSIDEFHKRQKTTGKQTGIPKDDIDYLSDPHILTNFNVHCSENGVAGNGALMRLAPVPLFFFRNPKSAVEYSGISGQITHGDVKAYDACRYYAALIVAALRGYSKEKLLDEEFYSNRRDWFSEKPLCPEIEKIARGSYKKKGGYDDGIRGKGYIVAALEAALWAFWSDGNSFEEGALKAVNLGDDTDTTAAIYGQLAGACYGYNNLPKKWVEYVYARRFMLNLSEWIVYEGQNWQLSGKSSAPNEAGSSNATANGSHKSIVADASQNEYYHSGQKNARSDEDVVQYRCNENQGNIPVSNAPRAGTETSDKRKSKQTSYSHDNDERHNRGFGSDVVPPDTVDQSTTRSGSARHSATNRKQKEKK